MNQMSNQGQQQVVNVNLNELVDIQCDECGSLLWNPCVGFKILPAIYSKTGREELMPVQTAVCLNCGMTLGAVIERLQEKKDAIV